jgi:hypothetical protein
MRHEIYTLLGADFYIFGFLSFEKSGTDLKDWPFQKSSQFAYKNQMKVNCIYV